MVIDILDFTASLQPICAMNLFFSHASSDGLVLSQTLQSDDLEAQMDVLNCFVAFGYTLLSAYLIDEQGCRTDLSIDAFNGEPIGDCMRELQKQYQKVLSS